MNNDNNNHLHISGAMVNVGMKDPANSVSINLHNAKVQQNQYQRHQNNQIKQQQQNVQQQQQQQPVHPQDSKIDQNKSLNSDNNAETREDNQSHANVLNSNLANMKEKTPMCLVNELARFNKIQHQYRLTNEQGPAHKKRFTVTLKLGEEEYVAEGLSIKKAQHSAATEALSKTWYRQPPPKPTKAMKAMGHGKSSASTGEHKCLFLFS